MHIYILVIYLMMTKIKRREIIKRFDRLPFEIQIKILDLAEAATPSSQKGVSGKKLFVGLQT